MAVLNAGTMFPTTLVSEMFNKVKGHSSIAKMVSSTPIPFNGNTEFTFSPDNKVSVVGEGAQKPAGDVTVTPVTIRPVKVLYQARVSSEFLYASEEAKLNYLKAFTDGFAAQIASGLDEMIMHGVNPATGTASSVIGTNNLDAQITKKVQLTAAPNTDVDAAIALVDDANGIILGKSIRSQIAALKTTDGGVMYPEFAWGATPAELGGIKVDANKTVEAANADARAYVGDFNALKWGFAKNIPLEVIEYGDPDNTGVDLKGSNQVMLRSEAFVGWGILDANAFSMVTVESL
ncbi:MAG: phage major capsid protein [Bacilli bacterium]|nr:phage major capsid protein [Bacilli bacterium]